MIKRIIALFSAICMTTALSGCGVDEAPGDYVSQISNIVDGKEYECGDFKFTISDKYIAKYENDALRECSFNRGVEFDTLKIEIKNRNINFADLKTYIKEIAKDAEARSISLESIDDIEIKSKDIVTDLPCEYAAGAVHLVLENDTGVSAYFVENESCSLEIKATYELSDKESVCGDMNALVASAEYISDYKLPTEDTDFDCDYFSLTVPPEWLCNGYENDSYTVRLGKSRAKTADESATSINIKIGKSNGKTSKQQADNIFEKYKSLGGKARRTTYKMFGIKTECAEVTLDDDLNAKSCYFDRDGDYWNVTLYYYNKSELKDIEKLLERIELKS